jgi:hypothetical protein
MKPILNLYLKNVSIVAIELFGSYFVVVYSVLLLIVMDIIHSNCHFTLY